MSWDLIIPRAKSGCMPTVSMNADVLIHDAEYTQDEYRRHKGWGHSSIPHVLDLAFS